MAMRLNYDIRDNEISLCDCNYVILCRAPLTNVAHSTARTQTQTALVVILQRLVAGFMHITKRNTPKLISPVVNLRRQTSWREQSQMNTKNSIIDRDLSTRTNNRCRENARIRSFLSGNVNPEIRESSTRTYRETGRCERERPESSTREDRLPRALLSEHFVRHRRPAEIARARRDPPTLRPRAPSTLHAFTYVCVPIFSFHNLSLSYARRIRVVPYSFPSIRAIKHDP